MIPRSLLPVFAALILLGCSSGGSAPPPPNTPPPPQSRAPVAEGGMCGGIAGFQCGEALTCQMQPGQCRAVADASGVCRKAPRMCTKIYAPVCGCDGKTYGNACTAAAEGVSVAAEGECKA